MNHKKTLFAFAAGLLLCSATAQTTNVITIEGEKVLKESKQGIAINEKLMKRQAKLAAPLQEEEQKIKNSEKKFLAAKKDFDKKLKELQGKSSELLSPEAREKKGEKLRQEGQALEDMQMTLQKKVQRFQESAKGIEQKMNNIYQKEMTNFNKKIQNIIEKVATREEWDVALMKESTIYAHPSTDKTQMIIDELDKGYKSAPAPQAAKAA